MTALMWGCFCGILGQKEGDENGFFWNCSDHGYYWSCCISGSNDISEQQTRRKNETTGIRTSGQDRKTAARSWDLWRVHSCGGGLCSGCQHRRSSRIWKTFCAAMYYVAEDVRQDMMRLEKINRYSDERTQRVELLNQIVGKLRELRTADLGSRQWQYISTPSARRAT